jgi:ubiquinone/menaquinone biosynthesis C-methylase UbiE
MAECRCDGGRYRASFPMMHNKQQVHDFWNNASCGEDLYLRGADAKAYAAQAAKRYELEPYIQPFADFDGAAGKQVLEVGVGLGADHERFAAAGALLHGVDLTQRAVSHTQQRLAESGLSSDIRVADAENLPFPVCVFDRVYSWGVIHHSPDTPRAVSEIHRVLKPGGKASVMIYHKHSMVGYMLWLRYALLTGRPGRTLSDIYAAHLESPGTKAYSVAEARQLFRAFSSVHIKTVLTHGDLLTSEAGQRHKGFALTLARLLWPRALIRALFPTQGLFMLITAVK